MIRFGFSNESEFDNVKIPRPLTFTDVNGTIRMTVEELVHVEIVAQAEEDESEETDEYESDFSEDEQGEDDDNGE